MTSFSVAGELLLEFFAFYSEFDFAKHGVSLYHGQAVDKTTECPIFVENFFYSDTNICKNVSGGVLASFQRHCASARVALEVSLSKRRDSHANWGLLSILDFTDTEAAAFKESTPTKSSGTLHQRCVNKQSVTEMLANGRTHSFTQRHVTTV